jgi:hypothetical protein
MNKKIIHAGIIAVLAGSALTAAVPAQASQPSRARPAVNPGYEYIDTFYSDAQKTTVVGKYAWGACGNYSTGNTYSPYYTTFSYQCSGVGQ